MRFIDPDSGERVSTGHAKLIQNLDDLPFVDLDLFNLDDHVRAEFDGHQVTNTIITQRGCPFNCTFCQSDAADRKNAYLNVRENSAQYKFDYVKHRQKTTGHNYIIFIDANFTLNKKVTTEFLHMVIDSGLNETMRFQCETNVALKLELEFCQLLRKAGFENIALGVERLNQESLRLIRKNKNFNIIHNNIDNLNAAGINLSACALIGFPFDNKDTVAEEEKNFAEIYDKLASVQVSVLQPMPDTNVYQYTNHKKWYADRKYLEWKPPFYHYAYKFNSDAWARNYFDLDEETMAAVRGMTERMFKSRIDEINNRFIDFLFVIVQGLASVSYFLYRKVPVVERVLFFPVVYVYRKMWKFMVYRYDIG